MPTIGPHNGMELPLMLRGEKPLSLFVGPADADYVAEDEKFAPHVQNGTIGRLTTRNAVTGEIVVLFHLPGEEWRAKILLLLHSVLDRPDLVALFDRGDLVRIFGHMLGYPPDDIALSLIHI